MSVINKNPVINQIIQSMDDEEFDFLKNVMDTKEEKDFVVFSDLPTTNNICLAIFQLPFKTPLRGILWNEDNDKYYLINVFNGQKVEIYHIVNNKAEKVQEECSLLEIRLWILAKESGSGGELTPTQLLALMEAEANTDNKVDLNADGDKVVIGTHQKAVTLSAPSTATSGTLTEQELAALQESPNSYIVFNNEKYYLNDNGHISGYRGYSHIGYENSKFILKNITITESTLGWVLSTEEVGGGVAGVDFAITLEPLNPQLTEFEVTSNNYAEEIAEYVETHNKMPKVAGIVIAGDDKYLCLGTQIDVEDDGVVIVGVVRNDYYSNTKYELHINIEMEPGHSGTSGGQTATSDNDSVPFSHHETYTITTAASGIYVPLLTLNQVKALYGAATSGMHTYIVDSSGNTEYLITCAKIYKSQMSIQIIFEDKAVIYYLDTDQRNVLIDVLKGSKVIEVHSVSDLPTAANTDGTVKIVVCDNGLLPSVSDQLSGYIYFEKDA